MPICSSSSTLSSPLKWRRAAAHRALAAQLSSFLLHHKNALSILRSKIPLLPRPFPSSLLRRILTRNHSHPAVSLRFFLFARSHLSFSPGLTDLSTISSILVAAGHLSTAAGLFSPVLLSHPPPTVLKSLLRSSSYCIISQSVVLSFVLELYCEFPSANAMETFLTMRDSRLVPSIRSVSKFLTYLNSIGEIDKAWSVFAAALRLGTEMDDGIWEVLLRLLLQDGKLQRAEILLNSGFGERPSSYDLVVDSYACRREFAAALRVLNGMEQRGFSPKLGTLSSVLEGSCRFGDLKLAGLIMKEMAVKGLLPMAPTFDFDWIIARFCEMGRCFSSMMIFEKARRANYDLGDASYASMLGALAQKGQTNEAMKVFDIMSQRGISLDHGGLGLFVSGICNVEPQDEVDSVIMDVMRDGFLPKSSDLSRYLTENYSKGRWKEATELLDFALDKGILLDSSCCCSLLNHFCKNGLLDLAIGLHKRVRGLGGFLNSKSYNELLEALVMEGRTAESIEIFDFMREKNVFSSFSFVIMIHVLLHEELRKAMTLHDEMLKLGLKPDTATYKRMISGFQ
ncbi:Pentatricopeptide repeat-containing protein [Platanthera zijinensis]|uniref:Pentatricopeptide repeat-containing protein n=1 Tax=Platanthera zijinensis TaxID=2320716 RepID=A0AAP0BSA3_9ASPA